MKKQVLLSGLIFLVVILAGCEKPLVQNQIPIYPPHEKPYSALEKKIRELYD
jgi:hypothetical protein